MSIVPHLTSTVMGPAHDSANQSPLPQHVIRSLRQETSAMKILITLGALFLIAVVALWSNAGTRLDQSNSNLRVVAQSDESCPEESLSQEDAEDGALMYASSEHFEDAEVVVSDLVTFDELAELYAISPSYTTDCYWYVKMSGHKIIERWSSSTTPTPTPGPNNTFITMEVILDSVSGYLASKQLGTTQLVSPVTLTPGPSPTLISPPTVRPIPPTPTFSTQ